MAEREDDYSPKETARRRDAVLKIMVNTPPQPRSNGPRARSKKQKSTGAVRVKAQPFAHHGKP